MLTPDSVRRQPTPNLNQPTADPHGVIMVRERCCLTWCTCGGSGVRVSVNLSVVWCVRVCVRVGACVAHAYVCGWVRPDLHLALAKKGVGAMDVWGGLKISAYRPVLYTFVLTTRQLS